MRTYRHRSARTSAGALLVAASLAALTACGSSSSSGSGGSGAGPAGGAAGAGAPAAATYTGSAVVNLTYWSWTANAQAVVDAFNQSHPNIHVTYVKNVGGADGYSKVFDAFKAGNAPDVFNVEYAELPSFVSQGDVQDLSKYVTADLKSKLGTALPLTTLGGKTWSIPFDVEPQELWYRTDLFAKYGLAPPKTWDDFKADAQKLHAAAPNAKLVNVPLDDPYWLAGLSAQAGASWFGTSNDTWKVNFTDAASKKVAAYWQDLVDSGLVATQQSSSPAYTKDLAAGNILSLIAPPYQGAYLKSGNPSQAGDWAVAPLPNWGTPAAGVEGGSSTAVSKSAKNVAAATEFAQWLATDSAAVKARVAGGASTALPADPAMADLAQQAFDGSFYHGQDIFAVAKTAATTVPPSWIWGPTMIGTVQGMTTAMGKVGSGGKLADVLQTGQDTTLSLMKSAGLSASAG